MNRYFIAGWSIAAITAFPCASFAQSGAPLPPITSGAQADADQIEMNDLRQQNQYYLHANAQLLARLQEMQKQEASSSTAQYAPATGHPQITPPAPGNWENLPGHQSNLPVTWDAGTTHAAPPPRASPAFPRLQPGTVPAETPPTHK